MRFSLVSDCGAVFDSSAGEGATSCSGLRGCVAVVSNDSARGLFVYSCVSSFEFSLVSEFIFFKLYKHYKMAGTSKPPQKFTDDEDTILINMVKAMVLHRLNDEDGRENEGHEVEKLLSFDEDRIDGVYDFD